MFAVILPDVLRLVTVFVGGFVVGAGCTLLLARAAWYRTVGLPDGQRAMYALAAVNGLTLTFIAVVLFDRWSEPIGWRWAAAVLIFCAKGVFFVWLRRLGLEQERRLLFVASP